MIRWRYVVLVFLSGLVAGLDLAADDSRSTGESVRVLAPDQRPNDARLGNRKTLNDHFPFQSPENPAQWYSRSDMLRRQVLVATGLWPMPNKTPLNASIFGKTRRDGFTVEKVVFESLPGHFVTGLLFRPSEPSAEKRPGVLSPHGHGGRNQAFTDEELAAQLKEGGEHFAGSGRMPKLARCAQLARMGCVTFIFDMLGYADSIQIEQDVAHKHAAVRPTETELVDGAWTFFSIQADSRLQSIMGLQTWNAIRALDFLASLPDVDAERLGVTGGSGGGTQSILLGAIDDRIKVSFPNGMVSTAMQGGCYCENCNLLRIGTGNVELAALFAPRPQGMTAADDWTSEMMTDGYPQLKWLYAMIGDERDVYCRPLLQFKHNYNYVSRATMYQWFNRHLKLGLDDPVIEQDFEPLTQSEITVWDAQHPPPAEVGITHERSVCRWFDEQATEKLKLGEPLDEVNIAEFRYVVGGAWQAMMGCEIPAATNYTEVAKGQNEYRKWTKGMLRDPALGTELPLVSVTRAEGPDPEKGVVIFTSVDGKEKAFKETGLPGKTLYRLIRAGYTVMLPDLLGQGEFLKDGEVPNGQTVIDDPRPYSAFTFGYNPTLVASRCADLLTVVAHARLSDPSHVTLVGMNGSCAWAAPAAAIAGPAIDHTVIKTDGFRFDSVKNYRDPNFVPGAVKYGDLPAILALRAPHSLFLAGDTPLPPIVASAFLVPDVSDSIVEPSSIKIYDEVNSFID